MGTTGAPLSTARFYDQATGAFARLSGRAQQLNNQVATGKRLQQPSDDAAAYRRLQGLAAADADDAAYKTNLTVASGTLAQADSTLSSFTDQLQHASELAVRANNGTLTAADRGSIADELDQVLENMAALANGTDANGRPLFGGADGGQGAVKKPDGSYQLATGSPSAIPVADGQSVQASDPAAKVFGFRGRNGPTDALQVVAALSAALRSGTFGQAGDASGDDAVADLSAASDQAGAARASLGARAARVDILQGQQLDRAADRGELRSQLEGSTAADQTAAITELQKTMTVLQATQASFAKLQQLSLFDYLR